MWLFNPTNPNRGSVLRQEIDGQRWRVVDQGSLPPWFRVVATQGVDPVFGTNYPWGTGVSMLKRVLQNGRLQESIREQLSPVNAFTYTSPVARLANKRYFSMVVHVPAMEFRRPSIISAGLSVDLTNTETFETTHRDDLTVSLFRELVAEIHGNGQLAPHPTLIDLWDHPVFGGANLAWCFWEWTPDEVSGLNPVQPLNYTIAENVIVIGDNVVNVDLDVVASQGHLWEMNWIGDFRRTPGERMPMLTYGAWCSFHPEHRLQRYDIRQPITMAGKGLFRTSDAIGPVEVFDVDLMPVTLEPAWL